MKTGSCCVSPTGVFPPWTQFLAVNGQLNVSGYFELLLSLQVFFPGHFPFPENTARARILHNQSIIKNIESQSMNVNEVIEELTRAFWDNK